MTKSLVVHGHFYQPPRENPWTEMVEREAGAHPFHDWNERIHFECYRPNAFARVVDQYGRVTRIVNNYAYLSFNFGPTLLSWIERERPVTYRRIVEADRLSQSTRGGHGNAVAQSYHHSILPLANERDRRTEVRWGVADFRRRFGRDPESLWLPETACDDATLSTLIEEGLKYVILSPYQAERVRRPGSQEWTSAGGGAVDPGRPYKYLHRDGSGRSIAIFFYDGQISKAIAFENLLASSHTLVRAFDAAAADGRLVSVATDGESYGHHFKFGDRCLAYALETVAPAQGLRVTNFGQYLEENPPEFEAEIRGGEGSAWSCAHGVGRWARDCGCHAGAPEGWNQQWRAPLRQALDLLRDDAASKFESDGGELFRDPWAARDAYVELFADPLASRDEFLERHAARGLSEDEKARALTLLEIQRGALAMYTSCGWFFNDISGIEAVQVLRHAGHVVEQMEGLGQNPPCEGFLEILSAAQSNLKSQGTGADIYRRTVEAARVTPARVAAHLAIFDLFDEGNEVEEGRLAGYHFREVGFQKHRSGRLTLSTGRLALEAARTGSRHEFAFAAMHFGDVDYYCAVKPFTDEEEFAASSEKLWTLFRTASLPVMLRMAQEEFGPEEYGLEHLLPHGRQHVSDVVFGRLVERFLDGYEFVYDENRRVIEMLCAAGLELPAEIRAAVESTMGRRLEKAIRAEPGGAGDYREALEVVEEANRLGQRLHRPAATRIFEDSITAGVLGVVENPQPENYLQVATLLELATGLNLGPNLERAQEILYEALGQGFPATDATRQLAASLGLAPSVLVAPSVEDAQNVVGQAATT